MKIELSSYSLTVILPAYNEAKNLKNVALPLIDILTTKLTSYQIIIVNDGSTDDTGSIANEIAEQNKNRVKVIHLDHNGGIGHAYMTALESVTTDFVTWLPSDGEISLEGFSEMLDELNPSSIIVTYPQHHHYQRNFLRRNLSKIYTTILNLSFNLNLKYYNGNSIFPTQSLKKQIIHSRRFAFNAEALIHVIKKEGLRYTERPFILNERSHGQSKAIRLNSFLDVFRSYILLFKLYVLSRDS